MLVAMRRSKLSVKARREFVTIRNLSIVLFLDSVPKIILHLKYWQIGEAPVIVEPNHGFYGKTEEL